MQITEQNKQEADKLVEAIRNTYHPIKPNFKYEDKLSYSLSIINRQSVLEALRKIRSNTMSARDMIIDNNITNLTSQIEYLKSKL